MHAKNTSLYYVRDFCTCLEVEGLELKGPHQDTPAIPKQKNHCSLTGDPIQTKRVSPSPPFGKGELTSTAQEAHWFTATE